MSRFMQHSLAAIVAILITAVSFAEVVTVPTDQTAPALAVQVA